VKSYKFHAVVVFALTAFVGMAAPGLSQDQRVEINPFFGYSFSDGVTVDPLLIGGEIYGAVNAKSGTAFGVSSNQCEFSGGLSLRF
jgi:hypothetical protein